MSDTAWDHLLLDLRLATLAGNAGYGLVEDAALAWKDGRITFAGPAAQLSGNPAELAVTVASAAGALATPGLIDCHTHLVFAGSRVEEFEQRLQGVDYADIARRGGGILSTVRATRAADEERLLSESLPRARALVAGGVTTLEIKSGYGLNADAELKQLRVARRLGRMLGITVRTTLLGAHALPPEYGDDREGYIDLICDVLIPASAAEGLADAVDAYLEPIAFSAEEISRVFAAARAASLPIKLHADQLSDSAGAALAARWLALSADHLEYTSAAGVEAMAKAGTIAVLLPGAFYALRETRLPPVDELRAAGVPIAVATDLNPGTSPMLSLTQAMNMACTLFRLTPEETLRGVTVNAARALGLGDRGRLLPGMRADIALWTVDHPAELSYWIGSQHVRQVHAGGRALLP
ncbi:MAG TPA: imidazolonepropionase [Xanthomonadaceae bacterium]|nr:imidazolonepropionase [Xanthomonadaceae bacterium]